MSARRDSGSDQKQAREFIASLMKEKRPRQTEPLERASWFRQLSIGGREDVLFELEMLLRAVERAFERRHAVGGNTPFGRDFADDLRSVRNALHRAELLARRLTNPDVERGLHFRSYLERLHADARVPRLTRELIAQRTPEESLYLLRQSLQSLQRLADQLLRLPLVSFTSYGDFGTLAEQALLSSRYFRPPSVLEFRSEYDRVGSVQLLELVRRIDDDRTRKALALAFLATFRVLRHIRFVPSSPVAFPRRAQLVLLLARDETRTLANYIENDLPRLAATSREAAIIAPSATLAADRLRQAVIRADEVLAPEPVTQKAMNEARDELSQGTREATAMLAEAMDPSTSAASLFDGAQVRKERAHRLRSELWLFRALLRPTLDELFPAMTGEPVRVFGHLNHLLRFCDRFRQVGYHLLRQGDHEPFDEFFQIVGGLTDAPRSATRDRRLYLTCRRFLLQVERSLALVNRRAELLDTPLDTRSLTEELQTFRDTPTANPIDDDLLEELVSGEGSGSESAEETSAPESEDTSKEAPENGDEPMSSLEGSGESDDFPSPSDDGFSDAPADPLETPVEKEWADESSEWSDDEDWSGEPSADWPTEELLKSTGTELPPEQDDQTTEFDGHNEETAPEEVTDEEPFEPDLTRRIWRG